MTAVRALARDRDVDRVDLQMPGQYDAGRRPGDADRCRRIAFSRGKDAVEPVDDVPVLVEIDREHIHRGRRHRFTLVAWYSFRMLIVASPVHRAHHPRVPFLDRGHLIDPPEVPERVDRILEAVIGHGFGDPEPPRAHGRPAITRVHTTEYVDFLERAHERWRADTGLDESSEASAYARPIRDQPLVETDNIIAQLGWYSHDTDPILAGTFTAAAGAVDVTLTAWEAVADGRERVAYACTRPPGHHAAADSFAGYCYLNNAAIAAQAWTDRGARVAIVDVDYHHGNGTQQIFYDRDDVLFVSLHGDPSFEYPFFLGFAGERGVGSGRGRQSELPPARRHGLERVLPGARQRARSRAQVRSRHGDRLARRRYRGRGPRQLPPRRRRLPAPGRELAGLDRPTLIVQEGGYNLDVLGRNVAAVLGGARVDRRHRRRPVEQP